jgi:hypothetical protein
MVNVPMERVPVKPLGKGQRVQPVHAQMGAMAMGHVCQV